MECNVTQRQKVFWNMMGSLCNALSSMILGIIVNRITGSFMGGIFTFAFSNAQLMYTIGGFEVRPLQSTDVDEKYSFAQYFSYRIITCIAMVIAVTGYVAVSDYSPLKSMTIWVVAVYKMVEAVADVYAGMFQQHDRIDLSGKTGTARPVMSTIAFGITLYITKNLVAASASMIAASTALFVLYDTRLKRKFFNVKTQFRPLKGLSVFKDAFPLFIAAFINMYISNAPKYSINRFYSEEIQNYYNIIFMPAFVINLFSLFAFRPMLTDMARYWNDRALKPLLKIVRNILLWILFVTLCAMGGAYLIGAQILGMLNGLSIMQYRMDLVLVMVAGGISAIVTFLYYVITVMRRQKLLIIGYVVGFIQALIVTPILVRAKGLTGAVLSYGISMAILAVAFIAIIIVSVLQKRADV